MPPARSRASRIREDHHMIRIEIIEHRTEHQTRTVVVHVPVDIEPTQLEQYVEEHALLERDHTPRETVQADQSIADWRPLGVAADTRRSGSPSWSRTGWSRP